MISRVAWAVPPVGKVNTRPFLLAQELIDLGCLDEGFVALFHGRNASADRYTNAGKWLPGRRLASFDDDGAILSPVFYSKTAKNSRWLDFYDDWSIAPDINPWHRVLSALSYRQIYSANGTLDTVTCNSPYMAAKLRLPSSAIVPNGVAEEIGIQPTSGGQTRRLVLLGHFFRGRTDFGLIEEICRRDYFEEIVIGAPGSDPRMMALLARLRSRWGAALTVHKWISTEDLADLAGPQTAALIPHLVNDYTLSQDLMKVYTLSALGIRVICPRLLWPYGLTKDHAYLLDYGVKPADTLNEWLDLPAPDREWRRTFANENSWRSRAVRIAELIGRSQC